MYNVVPDMFACTANHREPKQGLKGTTGLASPSAVGNGGQMCQHPTHPSTNLFPPKNLVIIQLA